MASRPLFRAVDVYARSSGGSRRPREAPEGLDVAEAEAASAALGDVWERQGKEAQRRAAQRARRNLFDLAACNDFDLFFTLTLSPEEIDRYDYKEAVRRLGQWLSNRVRRKGLRYVAVPELHKDGAVHFHGLCNAEAVKLVDSGHKDSHGRKVYNVSDWSFGFTTAVRLNGSYEAVCHYIAKYITKQQEGGTIGGRYYFHGGELLRPVYRYVSSICSSVAPRVVEVPAAELTLTYFSPETIIECV